MIIESGFIVFMGLFLIFVKLPPRTSLKLLGYPMTVDIVITVLTFATHYGTFSGIMAAAVAGLLCSGFTSAGRWAFGYIEPSTKLYVKGHMWSNYDSLIQK
jgi:NhaP-type Na+/H+ or K+/H+ antiporter